MIHGGTARFSAISRSIAGSHPSAVAPARAVVRATAALVFAVVCFGLVFWLARLVVLVLVALYADLPAYVPPA